MNRNIKQKILKSVFCLEVIFIFYMYLFGYQGLPLLLKMKKENLLISHEIGILQQEVSQLEKKCDQQKKYAFYKEKIARESLQMARSDDHIFYLLTNKDQNDL